MAFHQKKAISCLFLALLLCFESLNIDIDLLAFNTGHQQDIFVYFILDLLAKFNNIDTLFNSDGEIYCKITILAKFAGNKIFIFFWFFMLDLGQWWVCHLI